MQRVYKNHTGTIDLFYLQVMNGKFTKFQFLMKLHQPGNEMMSTVDAIFKSLGISPIISKIELAWDFFTSNTDCAFELKEFLERHLFLKYQRNSSIRIKDTFYTNDLRNSVKGVRVYLRPKDSQSQYKDHVRLELELHRSKIKQMHIDFPIRPENLDRDFRNYFEFRKWDSQKLYNYMIKENRKQIADANYRKPKSGQLGFRVIESWLRYVCNMPLMQAVEHLKSKEHGVPNYSRFLAPMNELNLLIEESADKQRFQFLNNLNCP